MLLDLFLIGLVVNVEPIPVTAMILLLAAERGVLKGAAFVVGWLFSLVLIVAATVLITDGRPPAPATAPSTAVLAVKLACGAVLVFFAYRRRDSLRRRPPGAGNGPAAPAPRKEPKWMAGLDRMRPLTAAGVAFIVQPWVLVAAGVSTIADAKLDTAPEYLAVFAFCLWCTASYLAMEIYAVLRPAEVQGRLRALLEWINQHRDQAIAILSLTLGLYLMAKSVYGLVSAG